MNDYAKMIKDYEQQIAVIEEKIERRKSQIKERTATPAQRRQAEDGLNVLYEMRQELKCTVKRLRRLEEEEK